VFLKHGRTVHELTMAGEDSGLDVEVRLDAAGPELLAGLARFGRAERAAEAPRPAAAGRPGVAVRVRVASEEVVPELARWLVASGASLYELKLEKKPLEAWFLEIMGEDGRPG